MNRTARFFEGNGANAAGSLPPDLFEERYGTGAGARLAALLEQPCVTFAAIARRFGVSRERVRQWQRELFPAAPTGHARQRMCARVRQRRRLFEAPLFRTFFRHARPYFGAAALQPIPTRRGYRRATVRVRDLIVALRDLTGAVDEARAIERLRYRGSADFVYVRLEEDSFLFVPASVLAPGGTSNGMDLQRFRNSFEAFSRFPDHRLGAVS